MVQDYTVEQKGTELGMEPRQSGSRVRIPVNKCRQNEGNGKSPFECHNSNCCRQDELNAQIRGHI